MNKPEFERQMAIARMSRKDVADFLNLTPSALSRRVNGQREWKLTEVFKLSKKFGIDLHEAESIFCNRS